MSVRQTQAVIDALLDNFTPAALREQLHAVSRRSRHDIQDMSRTTVVRHLTAHYQSRGELDALWAWITSRCPHVTRPEQGDTP